MENGLTSDKPVTGVLNSNEVNWDSMQWEDEICLDCENAYSEIENDDSLDPKMINRMQCSMSNVLSMINFTVNGCKMMMVKYYPDETGDFSAIYNGSVYTLQVVYSKTTVNGALCSPCYPGQVDLGRRRQII